MGRTLELEQPAVDPDIVAIMVDNDGTVADTMLLHVSAWEESLGRRRRALKDLSPQKQRAMDGKTPAVIAGIMVEEFRITDVSPVDLLAETDTIFRAHVRTDLQPIPGAVEAVTALFDAGYPIGMATNGSLQNTQVIIECLGLGPILTAVVTEDDVAHGKPDPEMYVALAAKLGASPRNSIGIEDTPTGLAALRGAGAYSIALFTPGVKQDLSLANRVASWHEITPNAIKSLPLPRGR